MTQIDYEEHLESHAMETTAAATAAARSDPQHVGVTAMSRLSVNDETTAAAIEQLVEEQLACLHGEFTAQLPAACQINSNNSTNVYVSEEQPFHGKPTAIF